MKGKIIDLNNCEAFIILEDDTMLTIPLTNFNTYLSIGSSINITSIHGNYDFSSNHKVEMTQDKLIDFF